MVSMFAEVMFYAGRIPFLFVNLEHLYSVDGHQHDGEQGQSKIKSTGNSGINAEQKDCDHDNRRRLFEKIIEFIVFRWEILDRYEKLLDYSIFRIRSASEIIGFLQFICCVVSHVLYPGSSCYVRAE